MPKLLAAGLLFALPLAAYAQLPRAAEAPCEQVAAGLAFDVTSIRLAPPPDSPDHESSSIDSGGDHLRATNVRLHQLLQFAFRLPEEQIEGLDGPSASAHFDVEGKVLGQGDGAPAKLTDRQLQCMLLPMLADRFHLKSHMEQKVEPVFELVALKTGPHLTPAPAGAKDNGGMGINSTNNAWILTATGISMKDLAQSLAQTRHRPVIDSTGLDGVYNFTLKWTSDEAAGTDSGAAPSIVTALQEQLGLKLQATRRSVPVLIIDHAEMPSEN